MEKRKAIGEKAPKYLLVATVAIVALVMGVAIASFYYEERLQERQEYAQNAYNLGKAEYVGLENMPQEKSAEFQRKIAEIMNSELSLEEQKEAMDEVYDILGEYSDAQGNFIDYDKIVIFPINRNRLLSS